MKEEIDRLDGELREMERRTRDGSFLEPALQMLPAEAQKDARIQIRENVIEEAQKARELQVFFPKIEIKAQVAPDKSKYLQNLNANLRNVMVRDDESRARMKLWQSYARCKAFLSPFLHQIPDEAWTVLVKTSMTAQLKNDPHWASHRIILYEDMISTGKKVDSSQTLLYVEALRHEGHSEQAVVQWQDMQSLVKDNAMSLAHYELIGVSLFTSQGNPQKAEEIAFEYLAKEPPEESRILVPILATWLERGDEIGWKHAWALYLRLRAQLGSTITMDDYDNVTITFLNGGRTDLALAVFKDMMLTGQETGQESLELFRKALGIMVETQKKDIGVEDINNFALTSLTYLPRKFQNRFFYGSWLRKLISMGETDAAATVIELMYERGIKPDPKHMNGIIGAWFRTEIEVENDKAEKMAWAMVHERLDFVQKRGRHERSAPVKPPPKWPPFPTYLKRGTALANIETFSLLLNHYVNRRSDHNVEVIQKALEMAQVAPNNFFMNHLLYHEMLHGNLGVVWTKYLETFAHVAPDLETFMCLWDCEKKHLERVILNTPDEFPGPRLVMREMMNWFLAETRTANEQDKAREDFGKYMYTRIIRCMCLAKDFEGVVIALYALRDAFGVYPDADTVKMVTLDVARMGIGISEEEQAVWKPRKYRSKKNPHLKANVAKIDQLFQMIYQDRSQTLLVEHSIEQGQISEEVQQEEGLFVLAEFLRNILRRITPDLEDENISVEENLKKAASSMGVGGIDLEDPIHSYGKPGGTFKRMAAEFTV